jgi:hypothetical protein
MAAHLCHDVHSGGPPLFGSHPARRRTVRPSRQPLSRGAARVKPAQARRLQRSGLRGLTRSLTASA